TRTCGFCDIKRGRPAALDFLEPERVAQAVKAMDLKHAVTALLGVRREVTYEAQAAMELESLAWDGSDARAYPWAVRREAAVQAWSRVPARVTETTVVDVAPLLRGVLDDLQQGVTSADIAHRFHVTVAELLVSVSGALRDDTGLQQVALSGGVFQNRLLLELVLPRLEAAGLRPLLHRLVPANDGGVSLGQAYVAHFAGSRAS
ncbi:MAG: hypothetical protein R6X16_02910, partial [Anaerolineae bacterium]